MEIERLGENKIRCALSEEEIREMGYNIDEIIGNTEVTQEFMRAVVELVEEQGNISMQNISPVVKAELLQDHSMAITFGGDSEMSFKNLVDTVGQLMNQLAPEKLSEFRQMNKEEKQSAIDDFLEKYKAKHSQDAKKTETEEEGTSGGPSLGACSHGCSPGPSNRDGPAGDSRRGRTAADGYRGGPCSAQWPGGGGAQEAGCPARRPAGKVGPEPPERPRSTKN